MERNRSNGKPAGGRSLARTGVLPVSLPIFSLLLLVNSSRCTDLNSSLKSTENAQEQGGIVGGGG